MARVAPPATFVVVVFVGPAVAPLIVVAPALIPTAVRSFGMPFAIAIPATVTATAFVLVLMAAGFVATGATLVPAAARCFRVAPGIAVPTAVSGTVIFVITASPVARLIVIFMAAAAAFVPSSP